MQIKNTLLLGLFLATSFVSCSDNDDPIKKEGFEVPELTLTNTIQFTVDTRSGYGVELHISGSEMAIDWGDGEMSKEIDPRTGDYIDLHRFSHAYRTAGVYRIKIWADKLTQIRLSGLLRNYGELHVGTCPVLHNAVFNSLLKGTSISLNNCKNLKELELSNWRDLQSATLDECLKLEKIAVYTNPNLTPIDMSRNSNLTSIIYGATFDEQKWPKGVTEIFCGYVNLKAINLTDFKALAKLNCSSNNELTSLNLTGCDNLVELDFSNTQVESFDFSKHSQLKVISCYKSKLTVVNIHENKKLNGLNCSGLDLALLDVSNNTYLTSLDCSRNKLVTLDVSNNKNLNRLYVNSNLLAKDGLETIFNALLSYKDIPQSLWPMNIRIGDNPGTATCDTKIVTDKGWLIRND